MILLFMFNQQGAAAPANSVSRVGAWQIVVLSS